jgi:hypothetical protein
MKFTFISLIILGMTTSVFSSECIVEIENKYCAQLEWLEGPYTDAYSMNKVIIKDLTTKEQVELPGATEFIVWMIMDRHAHGGADVVTQNLAIGEYLIDEIYFFTGMNGKWQFKMIHNGNEYVLYEMDI